MKSTGIVRNIDELGRIVIPIELRRVLEIDIGSPLEVYVDESRILLKKYMGQSCLFCGNADRVISFKGKFICQDCIPQPGWEEVAAAAEVAEPPAETVQKKTRTKTSDKLLALKKVLEHNPNASQKQIAEQLDVTPGRISQLLKLLNHN